MARKSRKEKTAARKAKKAASEELRYEAAYGSKNKLAEELSAAGLYRSKKAARMAVDSAAKGERLSDEARTYLRKQGRMVDDETARRYAVDVAKPRAERARTTTTRREAHKKAIGDLEAVHQSPEQGESIKRARERARNVFDNGTVLYGSRSNGEYVRVIGIVNEYHGIKGPQVKVYTIPLYSRGVSQATGRMVTKDVIPGIRGMNAADRAQAIADEFEYLTGGHGQLKAFEYLKPGDKHGPRKK